MEIEKPLKTGILFTPPQTFLRRTWPKRFCALYKSSSYGIQRLEIFDNDGVFLKQSKSPSKIIVLTDCIKVTPAPQKQQANVFEVRTSTSCYQFSADTFQEMTEWLSALQTVAFGITPSSGLNLLSPTVQNVKQEENLLYSSMDEPEIYSVKALNTDSMIRNNLYGDYKLIITSVSISIAEDKQNKVGKTVLMWPYRHIRRYGCSKDNFSFEAGRKCTSGEGLFAFGTLYGSKIFQSIDAHVASLKSSQSDGDAPSSPFLDDEKNLNVFSFSEAVLISKNKMSESVENSPTNKFQSPPKHSRDTELDKNSVKPVISKPPRKSKQSTYANVQYNEDNQTSASSRDSSNFSINVYEEPQSPVDKNLLRFQQRRHSEHFETNSQILKSEIKSDLSASYEPIYAVLEETSPDNLNWKVLTEKLEHVNINSKKICAISDKSSLCSYSEEDCEPYDHLSLKKFENMKFYPATQTSDHIYGKLLSTKPSSNQPDPCLKNMYGSLNRIKENVNNFRKPYANVSAPVENKSPSRENSMELNDSDPKHFFQNNMEYARVLKNKKT